MGEGRGEGCGHWRNEPGFTRVATLEEIRAKDGNLSIPLYVAPAWIAEILRKLSEPNP